MADNGRSYEATGLRSFFDHQMGHLEQLISGFTGFGDDAERLTEEDKLLVEKFVDAANNKMRVIDGYAYKLREHVRAVYSHVLQVASEIPVPVKLSQDAFRANPVVNALFVNVKDIERLFKNSPEAASYLRAHGEFQVSEVYAVLTACKYEKSALGVGMLGNLLVRDVPQEVVNFSSHKLHGLSANEEELVKALKKYLFDNVVSCIKQEMASRSNAESLFQQGCSYESRLKSLVNPDVYLNTLIEYIRFPAVLLSIEKTHFKLNKLGIKLTDNDVEHANEFDVHELIWGNRTRSVVLQVFYVF